MAILISVSKINQGPKISVALGPKNPSYGTGLNVF